MRLGFLLDPLESLKIGHDTTLAIVEEACRRSHEVLAFEQPGLGFRRGETTARARRVTLTGIPGAPYRADPLDDDVGLSSLDILFLRKDPPVEAAFLHATQLVELVPSRSAPLCVNAPGAMRDANEKLYALRFPDLSPETLVSADLAELRAFIRERGRAVLKPLDGFGGRGVLLADREDPNVASLLVLLTANGTQAVMLQAYLPQAIEGDKRILLLDGAPIGAVLRVPAGDDFRGNLAAGAQPVKTKLTTREKEICQALAPDLKARGLVFVGIDVIGGYLTEVNVTSPTGVVEVNALDGVRLERDILDCVEAKRAASHPLF